MYNCKSAYNSMFIRTIKFSPWKKIWKSWAPANCKLLYGWQLITNVGLKCQGLNLDVILSPNSTSCFHSWWSKAVNRLPKDLRKDFNSLVILVTWEIWKHRNACVFDGFRPQMQSILASVAAEGQLWCMALPLAFGSSCWDVLLVFRW
jgi:hypothetical protein